MNGSAGPIAEIRKKSSLVLDNCVLRGNTNLDREEAGGAAIRIDDASASEPCSVLVCCAQILVYFMLFAEKLSSLFHIQKTPFTL